MVRCGPTHIDCRVAGTALVTAGDGASDPRALVDTLREYEDAGLQHAVLALESGDVSELEATMRRVASDVVPALR